MSVLKYFKNTPRSPPHRVTGLKCKFFFQIRNEVPGKKKALSPPNGRQGPVAQPTGDRPLGPARGRQGGLSPPRATGGACRPTRGRPGYPPIKASALPFPPHLSPKIPPKIQKKKRGVRRRKAAKPCRIQHL